MQLVETVSLSTAAINQAPACVAAVNQSRTLITALANNQPCLESHLGTERQKNVMTVVNLVTTLRVALALH